MKLKSFTLVEILVVVTIIGMIAGVGILSYTQVSKQSRDGRRKSDIDQIRSALEMYRSGTDIGYPVFTLNCTPTSVGVYLPKTPTDPKCSSIQYYYATTDSSGSESCGGSSADPCVDYTLGAYMELGGTTCPSVISCGSSDCNYCVGPYGKK